MKPSPYDQIVEALDEINYISEELDNSYEMRIKKAIAKVYIAMLEERGVK